MMNDPMNPTPAGPDNRRQMIMAGVVALVLLCCCCVVVGGGALFYACGDMFMGIANSCSFGP